MALALEQANLALPQDVPVGAVMVRDGEVVSVGRNVREQEGSALGTRRDTGHFQGLRELGPVEPAGVYSVCHAGALPHVCRSHCAGQSGSRGVRCIR